MPYPKKPQDLYVNNGWYVELPGLVSPHFETLSGLQKITNNVDIVDAGTNNKFRFTGQIVDYGELTLTRTMQGSSDDLALRALADLCIETGLKVSGRLIKLHHKQEVFRLAFEGWRFSGYTFPDFDVNAEDKFLMTFNVTVDSFLWI